MRRTWIVVAISLVFAAPFSSANASTRVTGIQGQELRVSSVTAKNGAEITVTGARFDETVGIYLAYCVVPKKGLAPTPCGGGANKSGVGDASIWISSNPPPYAAGLAKEYLAGGRFKEKVEVTKRIGKFDCTKIKCAITIRADHLRSQDRAYDMFIPIKIK